MILVSRDRPGDGREGYGVLGGGTTATMDFTFSYSMKIGLGVRMMRMKKSSWMSHEKLILEPMKFYFVGLVLRFGAPHRPLPYLPSTPYGERITKMTGYDFGEV